MRLGISVETLSWFSKGLTPFQPDPSGVQAVVAVLFFQCSVLALHWQPAAYLVTSTSYADAPGTGSQFTIGVDVSKLPSDGNGLSSGRRFLPVGFPLSQPSESCGPSFPTPGLPTGWPARTRQYRAL